MSKQEEVLVNLLLLKKQFEEAARSVGEIINNPATKKLSDHRCEKLLRILKRTK